MKAVTVIPEKMNRKPPRCSFQQCHTALPVSLTGIILTLSRAAGETATILFTGVAFYINGVARSPLLEFMALPYHLYRLSAQYQAIEQVRPLAYATAVVLILLVFLLNFVAFYIRAQKRTGGSHGADQTIGPHLIRYFGNKHVPKNISIDFPKLKVTALIGPSGYGKSTLLHTFNRMHDLTPEARIEREMKLESTDVYEKKISVTESHKRIGILFQKPNPLSKSIYDNSAYALHLYRFSKHEIPQLREKALRDSYLWDEVKDELKNRPYAFQRTAATPLHCPYDSTGAGGHFNGRTLLGIGPHPYQQH